MNTWKQFKYVKIKIVKVKSEIKFILVADLNFFMFLKYDFMPLKIVQKKLFSTNEISERWKYDSDEKIRLSIFGSGDE